MKIIKSKIFIALLVIGFFSCQDLTELNVNPNGVNADAVDPNLVLTTVLTGVGNNVLGLGFGDVAGIMQHTQKDGWYGGHNSFGYGRPDWTSYYSLLNNNKLVYDRSVELNYEFHQGVSLVIKSMLFGMVTDLWGDAPYTEALKGAEAVRPVYDDQETIYNGILADLETANTLLSKEKSAYIRIIDDADVIYHGDPTLWRKLANSLMVRYYMRISSKKPDVSKAGIEKIVADPAKYPIVSSSSDDATMAFPGTSSGTSWPSNTVYDKSSSGNYFRTKMDSVLVVDLLQLNDPRIGVFAEKVKIPLVVDPAQPNGTDKIVGGKRILSPDKVANIFVNTNPDYVGLPSQTGIPGLYNLNPNGTSQGTANPHVSQLNPRYKLAGTGDDALLKARILSAAEMHFTLAEAALKGWAVGGAQAHYEAGVKASLETWGVGSQYATYIGGNAAYDGTLAQIMNQKWIASWTAATEAWFDYRRTGLPVLKTGVSTIRPVLPVRFPYGDNETGLNVDNVNSAIGQLEITNYSAGEGQNSSWSKQWLIQGTNKPW